MNTHLLVPCAVLLSAQLAAAGSWWLPECRYRTTVTRATPFREDTPRPVEAAIDFPLLLERAGIAGEFHPATVRVVDPATGTRVPCALRTEYDPRTRGEAGYLTWWARPRVGTVGSFEVYFDTVGAGPAASSVRVDLPPENLLVNPGFEDEEDGVPTGWTVSVPELASLARGPHTVGERSLRLHVDAETPEELARTVAVTQRVDVRRFAGQEVRFACSLFPERGKYATPVCIELVQLRADGSRIPEFAIMPRWLTVEMAEGQLVEFAERGRLNPEAATVEVSFRLRLYANSAFDGTRLTPEEREYTTWIDRVSLRPGERWPWPAATAGCFVAGALDEAPVNRGIDFIGDRALAFTGVSAGALSTGGFNPDRRSVHWGLVRGTLEFWLRPHWSSADPGTRSLFYAKAYMHRTQSQMRVLGGENPALEFTISDSNRELHTVRGPVDLQAETWHHIAATWDLPRAHLQLFVDGRPIATEGPGGTPWPATDDPEDPAIELGQGSNPNDRRSLPMQATIGAGRNQGDAANAVFDEVRISDVVRYDAAFEPPRAEFAVDDATRALFHLEGEGNGTHAGDDRIVEGFLTCEAPPQEEAVTLAINRGGEVEERRVVVAPHAPEELYERNRAESRLTVYRPERALPDPRFVELRPGSVTRTVTGESEPFAITVGGDWAPLMRWSSFRRADDAGDASTLIPRWRANDAVVPFSFEDLRATLAPNAATDAERAFEIFRYALAVTNYYDAPYCEDVGTVHRDRVSYTMIRALNIYPFDQCGPLNHFLRYLLIAGGISSNNSPGTHHQFEQGFYDGSLRLFDLSPRQYWLARDNRTVISLREMWEDPWLKVRQEGDINAWIPGIPSSATFSSVSKHPRIDVPLRPGERIAFGWHNEGRWMALGGARQPIHPARIPPYYGNGALVWEPAEGGEAATLGNLAIDGDTLRPIDRAAPASVTYRVRLPYVIAAATVGGECSAQATASVSWDDGGSWTEVGQGSGALDLDLTSEVMNRYNYWLRLDLAPGATLADLQVRTVFAVSPLSLPGRVALGENELSFVAGPVTEPVAAELAWLERHRSDLGVALDGLGFYLMDDENRRELYVAAPGTELPVGVTLLGRAFEGTVALEGLPGGWQTGQPVAARTDGAPTSLSLPMTVGGEVGAIVPFEVVVREGDRERRIPAQVLIADAALVAEAEAADVEGGAELVEAPEESGGARVDLDDDATLSFAANSPAGGTHALWVRMRAGEGASTRVTIGVNGAQREVRLSPMIGFSDWDSPDNASTKLFAHYGEARRFLAWYRVPDLELPAGASTITIGGHAGQSFDAALVLPQTETMDRAAMNLLMTWNFAPAPLPL